MLVDTKAHYPPVKRAPRRRYLLPNHWVHISSRTIGGRFAFVPRDGRFARRVWGIIGRAMRRYGVDVAIFALLSNHFHAIVRAACGQAISYFVQYVKSNLARLAHEYNGTSGPVWEAGYRSSNLLDDEAEMFWFRYILSHGTKEGMVSSPVQWPGAHSAAHLCFGVDLGGVWLDRQAKRKARSDEDEPFLREVPVELTPLTRYEGDPEGWRKVCREMLDDIIVEHAHREFLGADAVKALSPHLVPATVKRTRSVCFYANGPEAAALIRDALEARRADVPAAVAATTLLARRGLAGLKSENRTLPDACQWTAHIADALDERAIVGDFMPPEPGDPDTAAAA